jgi:hypothetical protein
VTPFAELPDLLLAPLEGKPEAAWLAAPAGRWCPGQIVDHVAAAIEASARAFESRAARPPMSRRPRALWQAAAQQLVFLTGLFPRGRRAPEVALPAVAPDRAATQARLRAAVQHTLDLERRLMPARSADLFVKHPVFGDMTLREFMTFHVRHAEHHARQIRDRLSVTAVP